MASMEKQKAQLLALFDCALARTVRLTDCLQGMHSPARSMEKILEEIRLDDSPGQPTLFLIQPTYSEKRLYQTLWDAKQAITAINPQSVRAARRANHPTDELFEEHIAKARICLTQDMHGALPCISDCFNEQKRYTPEGLEQLAEVHDIVRKVILRLKIFVSRTLSILLSGWTLTALLSMTLVSVPVLYYLNAFVISDAPSFGAAVSQVISKAREDAAVIATAATSPEDGILERASHVVGLLWGIVDNISKLLAALVAGWVVVLAQLRR